MRKILFTSVTILMGIQLAGCGGSDSDTSGPADGAGLVVVSDTEAPVITLIGESSIEIPYGDSYTEQGATVTDNADTGLTVAITGTVDTNIVGSYKVNYNVSDTAGNAAATVTRTISVTDSIAPVITLIGENPLEVAYGASYVEQGATVTDNADSDPEVTITGNVDTSKVGIYEVSYNASDASGNAATTVIRTVNITLPLLTGHFSSNAISGLTYTTETQSGVTDASGSYVYENGETITFSIGDTIIGDTVSAKDEMSPFDLIKDAVLY
ncbi:MAG: DUF5011 domain-containing protein, partial [Endozoicomonadaceae bacterium]|nr:DUF5011 domain-containing protein [Endozoicomonadaceae bacterium]